MLPTVVVFAKAPVSGFVKTRLIPRVGAEAACRLHQAFVEDTLAALAAFEAECLIEVHTDRAWQAWMAEGRTMKLQVEGDLGARMFAALERALRESKAGAMILGSDSPTLPIQHLREMLASPADVCLGPSLDGGFYAIACRKIAPGMFSGVTWSTNRTLEQTIAAVKKAGLTVALGSPWYDVDEGADLDRLAADPALRQATAAALRWAGLTR
ncbi:MAG TPA: TIGR04282 family arsenosugar biosynthesis glycosyltransferase [Bryobacteraceae bacterium]